MTRVGVARSCDVASERRPALPIAVVIATKDRPELLFARALASVLGQTRGPAHLVVVDDSSVEVRSQNRGLVAQLRLRDCKVTYLENARTAGASGSWNTALDFLVAAVAEPERLFVAVLDDDDAWAATYLEKCHATAQAVGLDMVAADLRRIEALDGAPLLKAGPAVLRADDFLTSNPGIQGSNLFVRLSTLLAAGGFDEALSSTTDRDLCIRLADLGTLRYARLPVPLVDHFAEPGRLRLSTRGGAAKLGGLSAFWQKYAGRMTLTQQRAHAARAAELFDWHPPLDAALPETRSSARAREACPPASRLTFPEHESFPLYVG